MNTHLGDTIADRLAIAEITKRRASKPWQNSGLGFLLSKPR